MKRLLIVAATLELGAGAALLTFPSATAMLLLGAPLDAPAAVTVARIAGSALLTLAVACWLASRDAHSRAARGVVSAMVIYNAAAALALAAAGIRLRPVPFALWPTVLLHAAMTIWCMTRLLIPPPSDATTAGK
jgi:hypothetical protein